MLKPVLICAAMALGSLCVGTAVAAPKGGGGGGGEVGLCTRCLVRSCTSTLGDGGSSCYFTSRGSCRTWGMCTVLDDGGGSSSTGG